MSLYISPSSADTILTKDLGMKRMSAMIVPKLLTVDQKNFHVKNTVKMDPNFMNRIITGDETWVYGFNPETKFQSTQWKHPSSPRPKKAHQVCSKAKVMLTVLFDIKGLVYHKYTPEEKTMT